MVPIRCAASQLPALPVLVLPRRSAGSSLAAESVDSFAERWAAMTIVLAGELHGEYLPWRMPDRHGAKQGSAVP
jgi:hypothetical protein